MVPFLNFSILADLHSYLRTKWRSSKFYAVQSARFIHILRKIIQTALIFNILACHVLKNLEIPAWPFFANTFFVTRQNCTHTHDLRTPSCSLTSKYYFEVILQSTHYTSSIYYKHLHTHFILNLHPLFLTHTVFTNRITKRFCALCQSGL